MKVKCKKKAPRTDPATNPGDKGLTSEIPEDILSIMPSTANVNKTFIKKAMYGLFIISEVFLISAAFLSSWQNSRTVSLTISLGMSLTVSLCEFVKKMLDFLQKLQYNWSKRSKYDIFV